MPKPKPRLSLTLPWTWFEPGCNNQVKGFIVWPLCTHSKQHTVGFCHHTKPDFTVPDEEDNHDRSWPDTSAIYYLRHSCGGTLNPFSHCHEKDHKALQKEICILLNRRNLRTLYEVYCKHDTYLVKQATCSKKTKKKNPTFHFFKKL